MNFWKIGTIILLIVILVVAGTLIIRSTRQLEEIERKPSQTIQKTTQNSTSETLEVDIRTNAETLMKAYRANEIKADEIYTGKTFLIIGEVERVGKDLLGNPYVLLKTGKEIGSVQVLFKDSQSSKLSSLVPNSVIMVKGNCKGLTLGNIIIDGEEINNH